MLKNPVFFEKSFFIDVEKFLINNFFFLSFMNKFFKSN